jgi:hypothetical protein
MNSETTPPGDRARGLAQRFKLLGHDDAMADFEQVEIETARSFRPEVELPGPGDRHSCLSFHLSRLLDGQTGMSVPRVKIQEPAGRDGGRFANAT